MLTLEDQENAARSHRDAARRADERSTSLGIEKSAGVVEMSEQVLKQAYDLRAAMETFYVELLGSAVVSPINSVDKAKGEANGIIPQTKENLSEIASVLDKLRHLISSVSMGVR